MSKKKYRNQKNRKVFPWPIVAFGGILLIVAAILFANQDGDGGGIPAIEVDQKVVDYGEVKFDTPKTFAIKVTNSGNGTLRFKEEPYIEVVEGC
jgi:hypothetical protein